MADSPFGSPGVARPDVARRNQRQQRIQRAVLAIDPAQGRLDGASHDRMRVISLRQFVICPDVPTETMRSNWPSGEKTFMSAVTARRFGRPRSHPSSSTWLRCACEFDTTITLACGNCRVIHSDSEPQPQPNSRMVWRSARPACSTVRRSASSAAPPPEWRTSADSCVSKRRFRSGFPELSPESAYPALFLGWRCAIVRTANKLT